MGVEGGGGGLRVAGDLRRGALGLAQRGRRGGEVGIERLVLGLSGASLLPLDAGPSPGRGAQDQAQQAGDRGVGDRLAVGDHAQAGHGRPAHGHTAMPGQPASS